MKAYTDLSQSKKLTEILPIESADMYYRDWKRMTKYIHIAHVGSAGEDDLPCWSLTALMDVLECGALFKTPQGWICQTYTGPKVIMSDCYSNPVDACYEMILRLKEKNLIWKQQN